MNRSRVTDLNYDGTGRLRMDLEGHPTDVIAHAREIGTSILGDTTWVITSIEGKLHDDAALPSDMKFKIIAERRVL